MKTIGNKILVTRQEEESKSVSGIIYKDPTKLTIAKVIAVGEDVKTISVGDELVINWSASVLIKHGDFECSAIAVDAVLAVL
jgi:co-chaperonin GroES (HSP10)